MFARLYLHVCTESPNLNLNLSNACMYSTYDCQVATKVEDGSVNDQMADQRDKPDEACGTTERNKKTNVEEDSMTVEEEKDKASPRKETIEYKTAKLLKKNERLRSERTCCYCSINEFEVLAQPCCHRMCVKCLKEIGTCCDRVVTRLRDEMYYIQITGINITAPLCDNV
ncbi:hypothetical protein HELRODRAFT_168953 [Helobdella robusta]|uniref:RING-type domain-containing protein n=1 Tax=Helobdella robusta TaxID=6412 RepID=T1F168_HELRO|nr:hypothetical protein HELRODRAFT_168953 [Helobdella robusta]ESO09021.1 hypothetical protein HELRODRAFT_168953 [Helobdella robusta]